MMQSDYLVKPSWSLLSSLCEGMCFGFKTIWNGNSRSRRHELSVFPYFPDLAPSGFCFCKLIFLEHAQMEHHHNHRSEIKTITWASRGWVYISLVSLCFSVCPLSCSGVAKGLSLWILWDAREVGDWRCCQLEASLTFIRLWIAS